MKEKHLKALIHLALVVASVLELTDSRSRSRKLLTGACAGWHAHATLYHLFYEGKQ